MIFKSIPFAYSFQPSCPEYAISVRKKEEGALQSYLDESLEMMQQMISDAHHFGADALVKNFEDRF